MLIPKLTLKIFLPQYEIDHSCLQLLFFLAKKVAKKVKTAESYPHTGPGPASRNFGIIPPHIERIEFGF